jgi:hexosaminidase
MKYDFLKVGLRTKIQIWKGPNENISWTETLNKVTADGYDVILSSPWYINYISYGYQEWVKWYMVEPFANFTGT